VFLTLRSHHAVGEIHHPHHFFQAGVADAHQAHAVVGQRLEAFRARRGQDFPRRRAPRDQLVDPRVDLAQMRASQGASSLFFWATWSIHCWDRRHSSEQTCCTQPSRHLLVDLFSRSPKNR